MTHAEIAHWGEAGILAGMGLFFMLGRRYFGGVDSMACGLGESERILAAMERRKEAEGAPKPVGLWAGFCILALACAVALTPVNFGLIYALMCLSMSVICAAVFITLRNSQRTRVAVLAVRKPETVIGRQWFAFAALASLLMLVFVSRHEYAVLVSVVCVSSLVSIAIAWRLTDLPAMLSGIDVPAEQIVDDALRLRRSSFVLSLAMAQTAALAFQIDAPAAVAVPIFCTVVAVYVSFAVWYVTRGRSRFGPMLKAL